MNLKFSITQPKLKLKSMVLIRDNTVSPALVQLQGNDEPIDFTEIEPGETGIIQVVDPDGNTVKITKVNPNKVAVPAGGAMDVKIAANNYTPNISTEILITMTAIGADAFCIWFGNGSSKSGSSNTATYAYHIAGIYTLDGLAGVNATGEGGGVKDADVQIVTVSGVSDIYPAYQFGASLYRTASAQTSCIRAYRPASSAYQDIGFGEDGWIDVAALEAFADGSQLRINKVYHPTLSSRDCVQVNPANMPYITDASGNVYRNSHNKPEWRCTGSEFWVITNYDYFPAGDTKLFVQFVGKPDNNTGGKQILGHQNPTINDRAYFFYTRGGLKWAGVWSADGSNLQISECAPYVDALQVVQMQLDMGKATADRLKGWLNNELQSELHNSGSQGGHIHEPISTDIVVMGTTSTGVNAGSFEGGCSSIILFNDDMTAEQSFLAENALAILNE